MKRIISILLVLVGVAQIQAYTYTFKNGSTNPLKVRVKLAGIGEPWYESDITPLGKSGNVKFAANEGKAEMARKFLFCISEAEYAPVENGKLLPWRSIALPIVLPKNAGIGFKVETTKLPTGSWEEVIKFASTRITDIITSTCGDKTFEATKTGVFKEIK